MARKIIFGIFFSVWLVILIILSVWPSVSSTIQQDTSKFHWDYLEHFLLYFILGFLYILWRIDNNLYIPASEFILFLVAGLIFSCLTEYIQVFIPGRAFNPSDMISNMVGIISGTLMSYFFIARIILKNYLRRKTTSL